MSRHTTLQVGGPADVFFSPRDVHGVEKICLFAKKEGIPLTILGGGSNVLISDKGVRGIVLNTDCLSEISHKTGELIVGAGSSISEVSQKAASLGWEGLSFLYGMPGSAGGALWMNARCYGSEISQVFSWAEVVDREGTSERIPFVKDQWSYKRSPFQGEDWLIVRCGFSLQEGNPKTILAAMQHNHASRTGKGHYRAPSAGSTFKNNRAFGAPSGEIIDSLGMRGYAVGGAQISDWHANMIINAGGATASEIRSLITHVKSRVYEHKGFLLEEEVLFMGDWKEEES